VLSCALPERGVTVHSGGMGYFLRNHAPHIAAIDLFVVPTISFIQLYVLVIVRLAGSLFGSMSPDTQRQSGSHGR
jgi:hypothetical protein